MTRRQRQRRRRRRHRGSPFLLILLSLAFLAVVGAGAGVVGYVVSIANSAPPLDTRKPIPLGNTSRVYAADGTRLGFIQADVLRTPVSSREMPQSVKDATVAVEDRRFFEHQGVDFEGVVRAAIKNLESKGDVQGGSTLTMQLVRNLYTGERERTFKRKIREAKLAEDLENLHPGLRGKLWILTKYLNSVPYGTVGGQTAVGIQAAARVFFDKAAKDLKLREAALLAGLPQAPSQYNPFLDRAAALRRRNDVLQRMADQGYIKQATADRTKQLGLGVRRNRYYTSRRESYFFDYVKSELVKKYGLDRVRRGGLRIDTTIDLRLQKLARNAMDGRLGAPNRSAAIVTIDPKTGYIKAMASSARYGDSKFNLAAQGHRQAGSTFKVMVLMAALRRGIDPSRTTYVSRPLKFTDPRYGPIDVQTYSKTYLGRVNLVKATLQSDNSVYQQLDLDVGPPAVTRAARDMGIKSKLNSYPAEGLGGLTQGVSPLEMANAYATIASGGIRHRPIAIRKVTFVNGKADRSWGRPRSHKAFSDGVTYEATKILEQNVKSGTGFPNATAVGCPAAGKTGTTDEFTDAWFVGFTPKLASAVWVGHANSRIPMPGVAGGTIPAKIWGQYMKRARGTFCGGFPKPRVPFVARSFSGKYANGGGTGGPSNFRTDPSGGQQFETAPGAIGAGTPGQYPPQQYASPPPG